MLSTDDVELSMNASWIRQKENKKLSVSISKDALGKATDIYGIDLTDLYKVSLKSQNSRDAYAEAIGIDHFAVIDECRNTSTICPYYTLNPTNQAVRPTRHVLYGARTILI
ncbi:unnamed protein product [Aspergillus oryzae]|nr:unnamed protein product [Aspergillus oryzae]GMF88519.1 unnamed protein product [Aspergillus oryzae]